jgi:hypothetical protein
MDRHERTRRRWQRNNMRRHGKRHILIAGNQTFCLYCLSDTDGTMYCNTQCRDAYHNMEKRAKAGLSRQKWTHERITTAQVRKEDKLDKPNPPKVHNAYCLCSKCRDARQQARLEAARRTLQALQPAASD